MAPNPNPELYEFRDWKMLTPSDSVAVSSDLTAYKLASKLRPGDIVYNETQGWAILTQAPPPQLKKKPWWYIFFPWMW